MKKTVIIGASENQSRFSNKAVKSLLRNNIEVIAIGDKDGKINDINIICGIPEIYDIHTISIYLNPKKQMIYQDFILESHPKRVIFNPGAENNELKEKCINKGIEVVEGCTIIMLNNDQF